MENISSPVRRKNKINTIIQNNEQKAKEKRVSLKNKKNFSKNSIELSKPFIERISNEIIKTQFPILK